jgi:release factor glutamine methyltransferase
LKLEEWVRDAERRLQDCEIESARLEAQLLAAHVIGKDRTWVVSHPEAIFDPLAGEEVLTKRLRQEPLAYILGYREFFGLRFAVNPSVLIPRQDTETLVEVLLQEDLTSGRVLDLGTGSGAIAIALKFHRPGWSITASDISAKALETAQLNAKVHGVEIEFVLSDLFENLQGEKFDRIVTNPPYIGKDEPLRKEVNEFEPHLALFAKEEGLGFYRRLAAKAHRHLRPEGTLAMEVGYRQSSLVQQLFRESGWRVVQVRCDLSGIERVITVQFSGR